MSAARTTVTRRTARKRTDIQLLRALAVGVVVAYHFWPHAVPGGFVGVDAFFVLSGFLITAHLWRDLSVSPKLATLATFYARRIKRLFPAAAAVVTTVLLTTVLALPSAEWSKVGTNAIASLGIVENWWLIRDSGSYFGTAAPSPLQHFWSLSVEEQFYVLWPIAILVVLLLTRRAPHAARRHWVALAIGLVSIASFYFSLRITGDSGAYFNTLGRVWEFGAGALLGLYAHVWTRPWLRRVRSVLASVGMLALLICALTLTSGADYPGIRTLFPVAATALVLLAAPREQLNTLPVLAPVERSVLWVGDASYSIYLWHWPILILLPSVLRIAEQPAWVAPLALIITLLCSAISMRYIERIGQPRRRHRRDTRPTYLIALSGTAAVALMFGAGTAAWAGNSIGERSLAQTRAQALETCVGAGASQPGCTEGWGAVGEEFIAGAELDIPTPWEHGCIGSDDAPYALCEYGDPEADRTILLWGDSHAGSWAPAFEEMGKQEGIHVVVAARDACPSTLAAPKLTHTRTIPQAEREGCHARNAWVLSNIVPLADEIVIANFTTAYAGAAGGPYLDGYAELVARLTASAKPVTMMQDVPLTGDNRGNRRDVPACIALFGEPSCTNPTSRALDTSAVLRSLADHGANLLQYISVAEQFCANDTCYSAVGGLPVYHDDSHLTDSFARSLGTWLSDAYADRPYLDAALEACTARPLTVGCPR